ncbi:MAG: DNA polymerase I [Clostridia bacterium]|nr:DNA polymerase I [Clostridia bacterium]
MSKPKFLILDANSIINRAFYGIRLLTTKDGTYTNAVYGFLTILFRYTKEIAPDYIAAAFDLKAPTFRHKMFDGYKATRKGMPEELVPQVPLMKEVLSAMNIPILEKEGFEADDIIGTVSRMCEEEGFECDILTGDKDDLQLASDASKVYLVTTRMGNTQTEIFDAEKVMEKYGVTPKEFIEVKALMGDTSDNIPGVRGIGEKGALSLIQSFHSLEDIYEKLDEAALGKAVKAKLTDGKEDAFLSRTLATIDRNVPLDLALSDAKIKPYQTDKLKEIFTRLEFKRFLKELPQVDGGEEAETLVKAEFCDGTYETIEDAKELKARLEKESELFYLFDTERKQICFLSGENGCVRAGFDEETIPVWKKVLEDGKKPKVTHELKEQVVFLHGFDILPQGVRVDTAIGAYLLEPSRKGYDISDLCFDFLGVNLGEDASSGGVQLSLDMIADGEPKRLERQTMMLRPLAEYIEKVLDSLGESELFHEIEMPLAEVLALMQVEGFSVDRERLEEFGKELSENIEVLTGKIYELAGGEFNINSPKQLATILFETLGLPAAKKTKTGYSTNAEVLEKLRDKHPIVEYILEYRQLAKLKSTYVDGLISVIHPETGKIHSSFNQTVTVTGRISSTEPNLQNIPVRTPLGREMRRMFIAKDTEHILVDADYSQIELRVLAHIAEDENMIDAFRSGFDIHAATAAKIFGVAKDEVTPEMRSAAKAINFGLVYGMGEFSLAQDLKISLKSAKEYMNDYLGSYPKVQKYMKDTVEFAKTHGYVKTMFGRRREIPEVSSSNFQMRAFGERVALNTPIQGSAADIIKLAMVRVYEKLKAQGLRSKLILQVHDELIIEAHKEEVEEVKKLLSYEMEHVAELLAPLRVDMNVGSSWYETK